MADVDCDETADLKTQLSLLNKDYQEKMDTLKSVYKHIVINMDN